MEDFSRGQSRRAQDSRRLRHWIKTIVAFANSVPYDRFGVLYIGVRNDGSVEDIQNPDGLQKTLRQKLAAVYPAVSYTTRVLTADTRPFLCVLVAGSSNRPHFAGPAYVRVGSETVSASQQQFDVLIAERNSKSYLIRQYNGRNIPVNMVRTGREATLLGRVRATTVRQIVECTQYCATLRDQYGQVQSVALERISVLTEPNRPDSLSLEIRDDEFNLPPSRQTL